LVPDTYHLRLLYFFVAALRCCATRVSIKTFQSRVPMKCPTVSTHKQIGRSVREEHADLGARGYVKWVSANEKPPRAPGTVCPTRERDRTVYPVTDETCQSYRISRSPCSAVTPNKITLILTQSYLDNCGNSRANTCIKALTSREECIY
jgi:hypothetical protein